MASILRPDFKRRRQSRWHRTSRTSKRARLSWEIPGWVPWCFVVALLVTVLYLNPSIDQSDPAYQTAASTGHIQVVDGDTVRHNGQTFRLVGFNTPESGSNAQCSRERALSAKATDRLQQLLGKGKPNLQRVGCACDPGTEGTRRCNYGRLCGKLTVDGRDVGSILVAEGLARRFECWASSCPRRKNWC